MKVDCPVASSSRAPTRVKMRSTKADFGAFGGHETTDVRHQHNQRVLANVGGVVAKEALRDVVMVRLNIQVVDDSATGFNADDGIVEVALHQKQLQLLAVDIVFPTVLN
jgi:hypothetical protein